MHPERFPELQAKFARLFIRAIYKAMLRSGLLEKKYRNDPTRLSVQFANRLRDLASYWDNYLSAKQIS